MNTFKKVKVVMLPTNEKANKGDIIGNNKGFTITDIPLSLSELGLIQAKAYKLYFLSDEEIKVGDWYINTWGDGQPMLCKVNSKEEANDCNRLNHCCKKIIATTELLTSNINLPVGSFNYLPQPSQSFVEEFVEEYNKSSQIKEVLVEYEEYGTIMKDFKDINYRIKINPKDNRIIIRKVRKFSEYVTDDLLKKAQKAILCNQKDAIMNENYILEYLQQYDRDL